MADDQTTRPRDCEQKLPTYEQSILGGHGRFGRWQGWVEKRVAERSDDHEQSGEERRRARNDDESTVSPPTYYEHEETLGTSGIAQRKSPFPPNLRSFSPTGLARLDFGSRFIPHSNSQINCVLPLFGDRFLLLGTATGLSVLVTAPSLSGVPHSHGPDPLQDAMSVPIWTGLPVWQMEAIDYHDPSDNGMEGTLTPEGVLVVLVGAANETDSDKPGDLLDLRAYKLASIASLARWLGIKPRESSNPAMVVSGVEVPASELKDKGKSKEHPSRTGQSPNHRVTSTIPSLRSFFRASAVTNLQSTTTSDGSDIEGDWELVADDLVHRWASDWISISAYRRGIVTFKCHAELVDPRRVDLGRRTYIALITRTDVHVYSTSTPTYASSQPHEFTFVKTYYLPSTPRHATFVRLSAHANQPSMVSESAHRPSYAEDEYAFAFVSHSSSTASLGLYISFGSRACVLRLADAFVVELATPRTSASVPSRRRDTLVRLVDTVQEQISGGARTPGQIIKFAIDGKGDAWGMLHPVDVPDTASMPDTTSSAKSKRFYALTKGKETIFLSDPVLLDGDNVLPFASISWALPPVRTHVIYPNPRCPVRRVSSMQTLAVNPSGGVCIQEIDTAALLSAFAGGGGASADAILQLPARCAEVDSMSSESRFLRSGGRWQCANPFNRNGFDTQTQTVRPTTMHSWQNSQTQSDIVDKEYSNACTGELPAAGVYVAVRRGHADWRVCWLGPSTGSGLTHGA